MRGGSATGSSLGPACRRGVRRKLRMRRAIGKAPVRPAAPPRPRPGSHQIMRRVWPLHAWTGTRSHDCHAPRRRTSSAPEPHRPTFTKATCDSRKGGNPHGRRSGGLRTRAGCAPATAGVPARRRDHRAELCSVATPQRGTFQKRQIRQLGSAPSKTRASPSSIASVIEPCDHNRRFSLSAEGAEENPAA